MRYEAKITPTRFGWSATFHIVAEDDRYGFDLIGPCPWRFTRKGIEKVAARKIARWEGQDARTAKSYTYRPDEAVQA